MIPTPTAARLVFRMVWRETRGAGRHFAFSLVCVAVGVAALVAVVSAGACTTTVVAVPAR